MRTKTHAKPIALLATLTLVAAAACEERGMTYGDPNSIIAVTDAERWEEIDSLVYAELERTIQTVRDEKTFTVTYQEPYAQYWENLRRFRQMLLIGTLSDPWMQEAIEESRTDLDISEPGVYQVRNAWSREQTLTLVVLPEDGSMERLPQQLDEIYAALDRQYRNWASTRMYMSGVDSALADTLGIEAGFELILPSVYMRRTADSVYMFRNDNPDPSELIRQLAVTWRSPAPGDLTPEEVLEWRQSMADAQYTEPQELVEEGMSVDTVSFDGHEAMQIVAQWRNPPDRGWPAGGPLVIRTVTCDAQDRTYLLDAWLYAPGKEKYEYMIQLETILDTFDCVS